MIASSVLIIKKKSKRIKLIIKEYSLKKLSFKKLKF